MRRVLLGAFVSGVFAVLSGLVPQPLQAQDCVSQCIKNDCSRWISNPDNMNPTMWDICRRKCVAQCGVPAPTVQVLYPRYYLLTILYAPPGCTHTTTYNCSPNSSALYSNGSSMATTTSSQKSFTTGHNVTADMNLTFPVDPITHAALGLSFSRADAFSVTDTHASSLTISKSQSLTLAVNGGGVDGVDHGLDRFELLLNPAIALGNNPSNPTETRWKVGFKGPTMVIQAVYACQILNSCSPSSPIPPSVAQRLSMEDYCQILSQDPFLPQCDYLQTRFGPAFGFPVAWGPLPPPSADPSVTYPGRFVPTLYELPYDPPVAGICDSHQYPFSNTFQTSLTNTNETQTSYSTTMGISLSVPLAASLGLKDTQNFIWKNTVSTANTNSGSQSATATIGCPSPGYVQFDQIAIYWDTLFGSFLFQPTTFTGQHLIQLGHVVDASGKPARHQPVELSYGGKTYHSYTNNTGDYKVYSSAIVVDPRRPMSARVAVGGVNVDVTLGSATVTQVRIRGQSPPKQ